MWIACVPLNAQYAPSEYPQYVIKLLSQSGLSEFSQIVESFKFVQSFVPRLKFVEAKSQILTPTSRNQSVQHSLKELVLACNRILHKDNAIITITGAFH